MSKTYTLNNGLKLLFVKSRTSGVFAMGISVGAGVYFEENRFEGASHLLEHLIGRSDVEGVDFRQKIYENGGVLDALTSIFKTHYFLTGLDSEFEKLSKVFIEGIFKPQLTEKDLNESKESIVSELSYSADIEPYKILRGMMWKDPRLSKPVVGTKESIMSLNIGVIEEYHKLHYTGQNTTVVLLSRTLPESLIELLEKIPEDGIYKASGVDLETKTPGYRFFQERNLKSSIVISFPTKGYSNMGEDRHYFNMAASSLTEYYLEELGSKGLIYDGDWVWNVFPENGDFMLYLDDIEHSHLKQTLTESLRLIDNWVSAPLDAKKFEVMRKHKILDLKTHTSIFEKITLLTKSYSSSNQIHTYEEAIRVYERARLDDVLTSFRSTLLTQKPFVVVSAGLDSEAEINEIEQILENYYK